MLFEVFREDLKRWVTPSQVARDEDLTPRTVLRILWRYPAVWATGLYRCASFCHGRGLPLLPGLLQKLNLLLFGLEVPSGAPIGGGLYIAHPAGTVIMVDRVGRNVSIIAAVTIGMRNEWAFPVIGDNVFIGAGARVLGGITIGDDVVIGANAVVIEDTPPGATVVGVPARVIKVYGAKAGRVVGER